MLKRLSYVIYWSLLAGALASLFLDFDSTIEGVAFNVGRAILIIVVAWSVKYILCGDKSLFIGLTSWRSVAKAADENIGFLVVLAIAFGCAVGGVMVTGRYVGNARDAIVTDWVDVDPNDESNWVDVDPNDESNWVDVDPPERAGKKSQSKIIDSINKTEAQTKDNTFTVIFPDGTEVHNVPVGTTKEQVRAKLRALGIDPDKMQKLK